MDWETRTHLPLVVGLCLLVAGVGLVTSWWTLDRQAGSVGAQS